jgi:hypothetical protein
MIITITQAGGFAGIRQEPLHPAHDLQTSPHILEGQLPGKAIDFCLEFSRIQRLNGGCGRDLLGRHCPDLDRGSRLTARAGRGRDARRFKGGMGTAKIGWLRD